MKQILLQLLAAILANPGTVITVVLGALGLVLGKNVVAKRRFSKIVYHAFNLVEDAKGEFASEGKEFPWLTKTDAALQKANEYCLANGWRPLNPGEQVLAKMEWASRHGALATASEVASAGAVKIATTVTPQ